MEQVAQKKRNEPQTRLLERFQPFQKHNIFSQNEEKNLRSETA